MIRDNRFPSNQERPTVLDLFAGAGGLSLGFEQAGFDVAGAVEYDPVHCATHEFNFPRAKVVSRDLADLPSEELAEELSLPRPPDAICGGPPCQGFSMIGKRALGDPRNALPREFIRVVRDLHPQYFLFENVPGLATGNQRRILEEISSAFAESGYYVSPPIILSATEFGIPQTRKRLFLLGTRKGCVPAHGPEPTHFAGRGQRLFQRLKPCPTVQDAIGDLPDADAFPELLDNDAVPCTLTPPCSVYAAHMRHPESEPGNFAYRRVWDTAMLTASLRTRHTEASIERFKATPPGQTEPVSRFFKLAADGYCNTLRAGTGSERGAFTSPRPIHYRYPRCITNREAARLHSFPDWFRPHVTKWHGFRQIGNSVPPLMARALASRIMEALGVQPTHPDTPMPLGDPGLLALNMTEACGHYAVERCIPSRTRNV